MHTLGNLLKDYKDRKKSHHHIHVLRISNSVNNFKKISNNQSLSKRTQREHPLLHIVHLQFT